MLNAIIKILLLSFFIGFISDIVLNYLSRQTYVPATVKALEFYFKRKNIKSAPWRVIISAINAGLTIAVALLITMGIYRLLQKGAALSNPKGAALSNPFVVGGRNPLSKFFPHTIKELLIFSALAFLVGYAADIIIYKTQLFGSTLNPYYNIAGAGLWGAISVIFAIIITFFLNKMTI